MTTRFCPRCDNEVQDAGGYCLLGHKLALEPLDASLSELRDEIDRAFEDARLEVAAVVTGTEITEPMPVVRRTPPPPPPPGPRPRRAGPPPPPPPPRSVGRPSRAESYEAFEAQVARSTMVPDRLESYESFEAQVAPSTVVPDRVESGAAPDHAEATPVPVDIPLQPTPAMPPQALHVQPPAPVVPPPAPVAPARVDDVPVTPAQDVAAPARPASVSPAPADPGPVRSAPLDAAPVAPVDPVPPQVDPDDAIVPHGAPYDDPDLAPAAFAPEDDDDFPREEEILARKYPVWKDLEEASPLIGDPIGAFAPRPQMDWGPDKGGNLLKRRPSRRSRSPETE